MPDKLSHAPVSSGSEAIYQNPADLELGILTQELPVKLTVLAQESLEIGEWRLAFYIIGESHFVRIERGGALILYEVLACMRLPAEACSHHHRFGDLQPHDFRHGSYSVAVGIGDCADGQLIPDSTSPFLELEFPAIFGRVPVTRIHVDEGHGNVRWWTLHLYPQPEGITAVRTFSTFNCE
jgi:hypothetical protein